MSREFATAEDRTDEGTPRALRTWLAEKGLTIQQWRADQRSKPSGRNATASLPGRPALSIRRRRQALVEALRR